MGYKLLASALLNIVFTTLYASSTDSFLKIYHPVATLLGGVSWMNNSNHAVSLVGTDGETFTYQPTAMNSANGYVGGFLGLERVLPYPNSSLQFGLEYGGFGSANQKGRSFSGIQSNTSTAYHYRYQLETQQLMGAAKLLTTLKSPKILPYPIHPYVSAAFGAAFNKTSSFSTHPIGDECSVNLTPAYANASDTQFSYNLGAGLDVNVTTQVRIGLGYRYANFGRVALGTGRIVVGQYVSYADSRLRFSNASVNQFLAQLTFIA